MYVDPVEQGTGDPPPVAMHLAGRADTRMLRVAEIAAGAWVHRADEHERGRIGDRGNCPRDSHIPVFKGCRRTSSTFLLNSGISSRNSTPLWAMLTSPGLGTWPPPIKATSDIVWCGDLKAQAEQGLALLQ